MPRQVFLASVSKRQRHLLSKLGRISQFAEETNGTKNHFTQLHCVCAKQESECALCCAAVAEKHLTSAVWAGTRLSHKGDSGTGHSYTAPQTWMPMSQAPPPATAAKSLTGIIRCSTTRLLDQISSNQEAGEGIRTERLKPFLVGDFFFSVKSL